MALVAEVESADSPFDWQPVWSFRSESTGSWSEPAGIDSTQFT